ncbi:GNAT family N-acetyltransferase [Pseudonocardia sp.]|uniref:GNAT family N-acetyltransferase n=1 Tax=Pseudonocardia sp. TaxID=60912 RepID=UPI00261C212E|nr:GNAT family N-acetyltransferase [Pseudonocardia sp.]
MTTSIRQAVPRDGEAIAALWHRGWRDGHLGHVPAALLPHRQAADFRARVPAQIPFTAVAAAGAEVIGFVTVRGDEVEQLYVAAPARGTGTAAALLSHGERVVAATHGRAWLAVAGGNARARRFYERRGWSDAGPVDYAAATAGGEAVLVPCRRYEKAVARVALIDGRAS